MKINTRAVRIIGIVSLLPGLVFLISPYSYELGGGCANDRQGARMCSLPATELNYPFITSGLLLTILGTASIAIFLYRRWSRDNPPIPEIEMENV